MFPIDAKSWSIPGRQHGTRCNLLTRALTQPLRDTDLDTREQWGCKVDEALASSGDQTAYKLWREHQSQHHTNQRPALAPTAEPT